jgi:radical SAM-linked protein
VAYTEGFSPRPKLSFGLALPTGAESIAEFVDVHLHPDAAVTVPELLAGVNAAFVPGVEALRGAELEGKHASLQDAVTSTTWAITLRGVAPERLREGAERALDASELPLARERKGVARVDDVRPAIVQLHVERVPDGSLLVGEVETLQRGLRPAELLEVCLPSLSEAELDGVRVRRTHQWLTVDGAKQELLPLDAAVGALAGRLSA